MEKEFFDLCERIKEPYFISVSKVSGYLGWSVVVKTVKDMSNQNDSKTLVSTMNKDRTFAFAEAYIKLSEVLN